MRTVRLATSCTKVDVKQALGVGHVVEPAVLRRENRNNSGRLAHVQAVSFSPCNSRLVSAVVPLARAVTLFFRNLVEQPYKVIRHALNNGLNCLEPTLAVSRSLHAGKPKKCYGNLLCELGILERFRVACPRTNECRIRIFSLFNLRLRR